MRYVVTYDIGDDRVRLRVATALERWGSRVQESVFECPLERGELPKLTEALRTALADVANGSIRVYPVCARCQAAAFGLGDLRPAHDAEPCIVV